MGHDGPHEDEDGVQWHSDPPLTRLAKLMHQMRLEDLAWLLGKSETDYRQGILYLTSPVVERLKTFQGVQYDALAPRAQIAYMLAAEKLMRLALETPRQVGSGETFFAPCGCACKLEVVDGLASPAFYLLRACKMHDPSGQSRRECLGQATTTYLVRAGFCTRQWACCRPCRRWVEIWGLGGKMCSCGCDGWKLCTDPSHRSSAGTGSAVADNADDEQMSRYNVQALHGALEGRAVTFHRCSR
jgi:hypothetical protein